MNQGKLPQRELDSAARRGKTTGPLLISYPTSVAYLSIKSLPAHQLLIVDRANCQLIEYCALAEAGFGISLPPRQTSATCSEKTTGRLHYDK